jgi:lipid-binding SYLF domain-containing protein
MDSLARRFGPVVIAMAAFAALAPAVRAEDTALSAEAKASERQARLQLAATGLDKLYQRQPDARAAVEKAAGYAVFEVNSVYALLFVGQKGKGVLFDKATGQPTFMLSARAGTGPGVGVQKTYQVFVFKAKGAMEQFLAGGSLGGDLGASVSTGTDGMARSFNPSIDIYQVPESGMAVQASWGGTVYSLDSQLQ